MKPIAATASGFATGHAGARRNEDSAEKQPTACGLPHGGCNSRHPAPYDSMRDCFLSYEYWREWKGMQLCRAKIVALLKARARQ